MDQSLSSISKNLTASIGLGVVLGYAAGWSTNHLTFGLLFFGGVTVLAFLSSLLMTNRGFILTLVAISAASLAILALYSPPQTPILVQGKEPIPYAIYRDFQGWSLSAELLRIVHQLLGVLGVTCSLLIVMKIAALTKYTRWLAFVAAVSFGLLSAFDVGERANMFRQASRDLKAALIRYENQSDFSMKDLIDAYYQAGRVIGPVKPNPR